MFGLAVSIVIKDGRADEAERMLHEVIVPRAQLAEGFVSGQWIMSDDRTVGRSLVIFQTREGAEAIAAALGQTPASAPIKVVGATIGNVVAHA